METCNGVDLTKVGADVYSRSPDLIVTVVAWAFDDGPVEVKTTPASLPPEIADHLRKGGRFHAWNAAFEEAILTNHFGAPLAPDQAVCTMQAALHSGLPAALEDAGPAIGAPIVKDAGARRLMLQLSKQRRNPGRAPSYWHVDDLTKLEALARYCQRDVEAERDISNRIQPLPPYEHRVSVLDRKANNLGVMVDLPLVARLKTIAAAGIEELNAECAALTGGAVTSPGTQTERLMAWLESQGVGVPTLGKEDVAFALRLLGGKAASLTDKAGLRVLEIRQEIAKSSLRKLDAMERCAGPMDRVRGQLAYYGASRTGRWAGRHIQPQNLPRGSVGNVGALVTTVLAGGDADLIRSWFGPPLQAVSSALRSCLIPAPGKVFVAYDLSQIEARVLAWLAGQRDILDVFAKGEDVYTYAAGKIGSKNRQLGKTMTLGLGFNMGAERFLEAAHKDGLTWMTEVDAEAAVKAWRASNPRIEYLWKRTGARVVQVLRSFKGLPIDVEINDKLMATATLARNGSTLLTLQLPSGRRLYYRNAALEPGRYGYDEITYSGVDQKTHRWGKLRTYGGKLVENCTQAVARDVIVEAALRIDDAALGDLVLSVHDELVFEVDARRAGYADEVIRHETHRRPLWAPDLPVAAKGGLLARYSK